MLTSINLLPRELVKRATHTSRFTFYSLFFLLLAAGPQCYDRLAANVQASMLKNTVYRVSSRVKHVKFKKRLPPPAAPRPPARPEKYAFFKGLAVSGVFSDSSGAMAVLSGDNGSFVAKKGELYDDSGKAVEGVSAEITENSVVLSAEDKKYEIPILK